ncbi:MAG: lipoyl(octanoyl) transferase LipB [Myxococcota bacterium]
MAIGVYLSGLTPYATCLSAMERLVEARAQGAIPDIILMVEHEPTITVGRARMASSNVVNAGPLPVVDVGRGGDVTLHGPGQLVCYPIIALPPERRDLIQHMRALESAIVDLLKDLGLRGQRDERNTGVWLPRADGAPQKVAAIGIACRRWVTWHGLALNLNIDVAAFERIHPCGMDIDTVTRLADHLDPCATPTELAPAFLPYLARPLQVPVEGPLRAYASSEQLLAALGVEG